MLSRAGLNRLSPRPTLLMVLAANAPDVDAVSWLGGSIGHLQYHRGYTHTWMFLPLVAMLPVLIIRLLVRKSDPPFVWWKAYLASLVGVASHILLDWTNSYGIRTLLPFSSEWLSLNTTFVVDPWIWAVLTLAVGAPFISSLVSSEIGGRKTTGKGWAIFALLFIVLYDTGRYLAHSRAVEILNARIYNGETPRRVGAFPEFANPLRWNAVVELPGSYWVSSVNLLEEFDPTAGRIFFKPPLTPELEAARNTQPFRVFQDFNQWQLWRTTPMPSPEGSVKVQLFDLRFGDPVQPGFVAEALVLTGQRVEDAEFRFGGVRIGSRNAR
jgi:inner membrane protein